MKKNELNNISYNVPINELPINKDLILTAMGYDTKTRLNIPAQLCYSLDTLIAEVGNNVNIKASYRKFSSTDVEIEKDHINLKQQVLQSGRIINSQIRKAESLIIFICTLGKEFDEWIKLFKQSDDMFMVYIADILGSELVELAVDWLEEKIEKELLVIGENHSNRFSPGYCNWDIIEQHKLFSFLPNNYCGITLNDSALMSPIKSVSGIYGVGKFIKKLSYKCSICTSTNCYKRFH